MHPQRAVLMMPLRIVPGDKIAHGRGPWAVVQDVKRAVGRPPRTGPNIVVVTNRGEIKIPKQEFVRVIRRG